VGSEGNNDRRPRSSRLKSKRPTKRQLTRSEQMSRVRSRNTGPELSLRRALWKAGARYRLKSGHLPGRPDIIFPRLRIAVFVHGCFWHRHDCSLGNREPKSNVAFWRAKFDQNVSRDKRSTEALTEQGWTVVTIWECELTSRKHVADAVERLLASIRAARGD
jgi:DNA mismatch endonuclease (patch repair protein)